MSTLDGEIEMVSDVTDTATLNYPDAFPLFWSTVCQIHAGDLLHPCSEQIAMVFTGTEHLYQFGMHYLDCDVNNHLIWVEDPGFAPWIRENMLAGIAEPVRSIQMHWRMLDFSVHSVLCEAEGYVHNLISAPLIGKPLPTPLNVGEMPMTAIKSVATELWGKAWSEIPCQHKGLGSHDHDD